RSRDAQAPTRARRAAGAEGADQDAVPPRLHDFPGTFRRHPGACRRVHLPRALEPLSVPTIPVSEPVTRNEAASESPAVGRRPLAELLPTGGVAVLVIALSLAAVVASFSRYGLSGRALVGAVFCPTLILLAAIDMKHKLLPNTIILPVSLVVGLVV